MSITVTWRGGDSLNVIQSAYYIGFFGAHFGTSVAIGEYQDKTHITDANGVTNYGALPNVKFIDSSHANWGDGSEVLTNIEDSECTVKLTLASGSGFNVQAVKLIVWDGGADDSVAPSNIIIKGFEKGNNSWTTMSGSLAPLILTPYSSSFPSSSYDYYIGLSTTPLVAGTVNTVVIKLYAEYY